ncbi:MAG: DJ-1/PfpI family protein [Candidatus Izemoplasmatales bacterium]|nr:DJ-1/PfpI family protein [Candidatus Izemoplasmatales bacterium]
MKIACMLSNGFEDIEALGTVALLRRGGLQVDYISVFNTEIVEGSYGTKVLADQFLHQITPEEYDGVFLPGGRHSSVLRETATVKEFVSVMHGSGKWLMAICAAPSVFGVMGLLDGVHYTSFPSTEIFMPKGIRENVFAIRDGHIITGRGAGAVYEFVYEILSALLSKEKAEEVMKRTQHVINE